MKLNKLYYSYGSRHNKKRLGRGTSSGSGKTSGRGHKGQNARTGGGIRVGFEGGQNPIFRRLPKFGFTNLMKKKYTLLNLDDLEKFGSNEINNKILFIQKKIKNKKELIKILGNGTISKSINITVNKISKSAKIAIEKKGGKVKLI